MRAVLVQLQPDDAEAVAKFVRNNFSAITKFIEWDDYTNPSEIRADLISDAEDPNRHFFGVYHQGKLSGLVRLFPASWKNRWDILYIKCQAAPKGLMTESVKAAINWLKEQHPRAIIRAEVALSNTRSQNLVERLGFTPCRESELKVQYQLA